MHILWQRVCKSKDTTSSSVRTKRRYLQRDEKWVVNAFMVFQRFYQIHQHNSKPKTYDDFVKSSYYNAFVKFGRFIMHINPLYPDKYIDYVLQSKVKLDHWARDDLYEMYLDRSTED